MYLQSEIIAELNELSMKYSKWFISYDEFKTKRHELLDRLEGSDQDTLTERSVIKGMVDTFSDLIKRI